jgi:hypothetical protein
MVSLEFFIDIIVSVALYGPGVDSASNRNEYQEYFLRPVRRVDNLATFMCRLSTNLGASTSWNCQGLSRPVMGLLYLYLYCNCFRTSLTMAIRKKTSNERKKSRPSFVQPYMALTMLYDSLTYSFFLFGLCPSCNF